MEMLVKQENMQVYHHCSASHFQEKQGLVPFKSALGRTVNMSECMLVWGPCHASAGWM